MINSEPKERLLNQIESALKVNQTHKAQLMNEGSFEIAGAVIELIFSGITGAASMLSTDRNLSEFGMKEKLKAKIKNSIDQFDNDVAIQVRDAKNAYLKLEKQAQVSPELSSNEQANLREIRQYLLNEKTPNSRLIQLIENNSQIGRAILNDPVRDLRYDKIVLDTVEARVLHLNLGDEKAADFLKQKEAFSVLNNLVSSSKQTMQDTLKSLENVSRDAA
jgi:hypothetical protein